MKYNTLLNEIEAIEYNLSDLERTLRLDSEFHKKEYIQIENILKSKKYQVLTDLVKVSDGNHMKISDSFVDEGIPYYRGQDISSFFIEQSIPLCITESAFNAPVMKRSYIQKNDILLSIVGTIGKLSLVKKEDKATCSCKLAILRPKNLISNYISIFLESKYGQSQIERFTRGAVQQGLILEDMNQLLVPFFSDNFREYIDTNIEFSYKKLERSKSLYKEAETILLKELDLLDFEPTQENIAIKYFSESFLATGRLDSEYYQPKYNEIIDKIKKVKYRTLGNIVTIQKSVEPGSKYYDDNGIEFIRVSNLTKEGLTKSDIYLPYRIFETETLEKLQPKKNTILLSKDGTVGIAYTIKNETNIVTSGAILHLTIIDKEVLPEYLSLVLNSIMVQLQSERDAGGSIIKHWKVKEIKDILIPIIDISIQETIENKIKTSFELKAKSKELLELSKRAVEVAIEEGEERAIKLLGEYNE